MSVVWSTPHHYKTTPVAFGPSDFFALLKAAGNFQTRFTQTVTESPLRLPNYFIDIFTDAQQMPMETNNLVPSRGD